MSITKVKPSKAKALADVQALIAGTQKHFPNGSLTIGNATFTSASLVELLKSFADAMAKHDEAKAAAQDALTAFRNVKTRVEPVLQGYRDLLKAMYGNAAQTLADFGLAPRKERVSLSVADKAAAQHKAQATRMARGTKGPKAKLAIKGTATTVPVDKPAVPPTVPTAPAAAPAKPIG